MFRRNQERKGKNRILKAITCMALTGAAFSVAAGSHFVENAYAMTDESDIIEEELAVEDTLAQETEAVEELSDENTQAAEETPDAAEAEEIAEAAETAEAEIAADAAEAAFADQQIDAVIYTDETKEEELTDIVIKVDGYLPENATVFAYPVYVEVEGEETYAAYQITILDENGAEYHSEIEDGQVITVTIYDESLTQMLENSMNARGWQKDEEEVRDMMYEILEDGGVQFEADEF